MIGRRVLLADDHAVVRQGLRALLERAGHEVVAEATDGREALALAERHDPDIAVLDVAMPLLNGLDAGRELQRLRPRTKVVLLTMYTDRRYVTEAIKAGIKGYVLKTQAGDDLVRAIREVGRGAMYLSPGVVTSVVGAYLEKQDTTLEPLTMREREVLQLVAEGQTTKGIARLLGISHKTAESHRTHIMRKLDIHEVAGLVRYAIRRGLVQP